MAVTHINMAPKRKAVEVKTRGGGETIDLGNEDGSGEEHLDDPTPQAYRSTTRIKGLPTHPKTVFFNPTHATCLLCLHPECWSWYPKCQPMDRVWMYTYMPSTYHEIVCIIYIVYISPASVDREDRDRCLYLSESCQWGSPSRDQIFATRGIQSEAVFCGRGPPGGWAPHRVRSRPPASL